jgi:hypothetical protein
MVSSNETAKGPLPVKVGASTLDSPMTAAQARRWGERNMDPGLRAAGFKVHVSRTDPQIHGGTWLRINYGK